MSEWLKGRRGWVALIPFTLLVAGLTFLLARLPAPGGVEILPPPTAVVIPTPTPAPVRVYVSGAVKSPGVYTLPPGSIVQDAVGMAGGFADGADLSSVNLAARLSDGQQVQVLLKGESRPNRTPQAAATPSGPVNINTASASELESLPSIGPVLAQIIIQYRQEHGPFRTVDALLLVPGIGPATLEKIRGFITLD
jgi:competence protein ComEA